MYKNVLCLIVGGFLFVGCSNSNRSSQFSNVGYSEVKIDYNHFTVDFCGSGMSSKEKVLEYALIRAAELTLANDFAYFKVERKQDISKMKTVKTVSGDSVNDYALFNSSKRASSIEEKSPSIRLYIKCYKEEPRRFNVINAQEYLKQNKK